MGIIKYIINNMKFVFYIACALLALIGHTAHASTLENQAITTYSQQCKQILQNYKKAFKMMDANHTGNVYFYEYWAYLKKLYRMKGVTNPQTLERLRSPAKRNFKETAGNDGYFTWNDMKKGLLNSRYCTKQ